MFDPFTLALIGAGTGALLDKKKPLRGAAIGGSLGYGGGSLLGAGGVGGSASSGVSSALSSKLPEAGVGAFVENPVSSVAIDQATGQALMSTAPNFGAGAFTQTPSMLEQISPYMNIQNLSGAANVAGKFQQPMARVQSGGGQVTRGQAPQGSGDIASLIQSIKLPEKRRISLL